MLTMNIMFSLLLVRYNRELIIPLYMVLFIEGPTLLLPYLVEVPSGLFIGLNSPILYFSKTHVSIFID